MVKAWRTKRWVRWLAELLLISGVIVGAGLWQTRGHLRGAAPGFELQTLSGETISNASLKGKPVLLAFWAPWCGVCKTESPNLSWVQKLIGDRARVISVASSWEQRVEVEGYAANHAVDYPVLLDTAGLSGAFKVSAFPTVYFLDSEGQVKHSVVGYTTTLGLLLRLFF